MAFFNNDQLLAHAKALENEVVMLEKHLATLPEESKLIADIEAGIAAAKAEIENLAPSVAKAKEELKGEQTSDEPVESEEPQSEPAGDGENAGDGAPSEPAQDEEQGAGDAGDDETKE